MQSFAFPFIFFVSFTVSLSFFLFRDAFAVIIFVPCSTWHFFIFNSAASSIIEFVALGKLIVIISINPVDTEIRELKLIRVTRGGGPSPGFLIYMLIGWSGVIRLRGVIRLISNRGPDQGGDPGWSASGRLSFEKHYVSQKSSAVRNCNFIASERRRYKL